METEKTDFTYWPVRWAKSVNEPDEPIWIDEHQHSGLLEE